MNRTEKRNKISLTGKQKCEMLRNIRKEIAQKNGIEYLSADCTHQGDCPGTCPKCDVEVRFLEYELNRKAQKGETISIIGINEDIVKMIEQVEDAVGNSIETDDTNDQPETFTATGMDEEPEYEDQDIDDKEFSEDELNYEQGSMTMGVARPNPINHKNNLYNRDVREIGLSRPVCHWLTRSNINTLSKLCSMTEKEILDKTMVGTSGINEIKEILKNVGLSLKGQL